MVNIFTLHIQFQKLWIAWLLIRDIKGTLNNLFKIFDQKLVNLSDSKTLDFMEETLISEVKLTIATMKDMIGE